MAHFVLFCFVLIFGKHMSAKIHLIFVIANLDLRDENILRNALELICNLRNRANLDRT